MGSEHPGRQRRSRSVSELITNALHASRGLGPAPSLRLWLLGDAWQVLILVSDLRKFGALLPFP